MSLRTRTSPEQAGWCGFRRRALAGGLAASLLASSASMWSQAAPTREATPAEVEAKLYRIAGTVTDSITGKALASTTLRLLSSPARETIQTVTTDEGGHFALEPVPAAKYSLTAQRRGYRAAAFDEHDGFSSAIVTGEGQDTEALPFTLAQGAVLRGVITDESGEPVGGASVMAFRRTRSGGLGESLENIITGNTGDDGRFEFWDAEPGTYFLAVSAHPWYAVQSQSARGVSVDGDSGHDAAALDVAYPVTFYGGGTEEAAATPIELQSGTRVEADIMLRAVPALRLTVRTGAGEPSGAQSGGDSKSGAGASAAPQAAPYLKQTVLGTDANSRFYPEQTEESEVESPGRDAAKTDRAPKTSVEFTGLAPGHYTLADNVTSHTMELDLTGNTEVNLLAGLPLFRVVLRPRMADGSVVPPSTILSLVAVRPGTQSFDRGIANEASTQFEGVPPGRWTIEPRGAGAAIVVVSVQTGAAGRDAGREDSRIVVKDHSISASVVLAQGKTAVEGFAKRDGKGQAGVMIVLIPQNPEGGLQRFRRDQSDSDGSFLLPDVVPGDYRIVAIEDGWKLDWARSEVLAPYLAHAIAVAVTAKSGASLHLPVAVDVQVR